jgi:hypothetical protein
VNVQDKAKARPLFLSEYVFVNDKVVNVESDLPPSTFHISNPSGRGGKRQGNNRTRWIKSNFPAGPGRLQQKDGAEFIQFGDNIWS